MLFINVLKTPTTAVLGIAIPERIKPDGLQRKFSTHNKRTDVFESKNYAAICLTYTFRWNIYISY